MNTPEAMVSVYWDILTRYPQVWVVEVIALIILVWFVHRNQLYRRPELKLFLFTGQLSQYRLKSNGLAPIHPANITTDFNPSPVQYRSNFGVSDKKIKSIDEPG